MDVCASGAVLVVVTVVVYDCVSVGQKDHELTQEKAKVRLLRTEYKKLDSASKEMLAAVERQNLDLKAALEGANKQISEISEENQTLKLTVDELTGLRSHACSLYTHTHTHTHARTRTYVHTHSVCV